MLGLALAASPASKGSPTAFGRTAVPLAIFMPLWADATYTLVRRLLRGHNPLRPHREHLYQRLTLAGLGHRGVLFWIVGWMLLSIAVAGLVRMPCGTAGDCSRDGLRGVLCGCSPSGRYAGSPIC